MLRITSAKVTVSPGASGWVQVHGFSPSENDAHKLRGQLFVIIAMKNGKEGVEAITFEREIAVQIREAYYNGSSEKPFDALKTAVQKVVENFNAKESGLEIGCCVYSENVVYSAAFGGVKTQIVRGGSVASILESGNEVITASGFPKNRDVIVVGTKEFFEKVGGEDLKRSSSETNLDAVVESLTPLIYEGEKKPTTGAMIISFEEESTVSLPQEVPINTPIPPNPVEYSQAPKIDIKDKALTFLRKISSKLPKRNIYIKQGMQDEAVSQGRKMTLSVGIILLIILAVSVGFGIGQKKKNELKHQYQGLLIEAQNEIDQAISLASVNPEESRSMFLNSESKLAQIEALKVKDPKVTELAQKISDSRAAVLGEYVVTPELFLDLSLLSSGFKGDAVAYSGGLIYVLDKNGSRVVTIEMSNKKSKVVAGPSVIENPIDLAAYEDTVFLLLNDGIYEVDSTKVKVIDKTWGGEALIHSFAGNLYVLDKSGGQIYRYAGESGSNFGTQQNWLSSSTKADFSNALEWGMNGSIYVLYPNSKILKYSLGSPQNFYLSGVSPEIGNVDAINADPDNENVYLLDKAGKRVVVIDKNGKYKAQYLGDQIANATKIVASESEKKIILLTGEKLLSIELK